MEDDNKKHDKLIIGDINERYLFYETVDELIYVQFIEWSGNTIKKARFTIDHSSTERNLYLTGICPNLPGKNDSRLSLHSLYLGKNPDPANKPIELIVDDLKISTNELLIFAYIKYFEKEVYDSKWTCSDYGIGVPDVKKGNILVGG